MEKSFFKYLAALAVLLCNCDNKYIPSRVEPVQIDFVRFDSAVLAADSHKDGVNLLYKDFGPFMTVFSQDIIGVDANDTAYMKEALPKFLNDTLYGFKQTNNKVREQFADIYPIEDDIIYGFSRLKYLFPQIILPEVTFFVSGFNASLLFWNGDFDTQEIRIAIGLDMYLGQDYELYNKVVYNYQKQGMNPECIPLDIMSAYLFRVFEYDGEKNRLIDNMIYRGKLMYVISLLYDKTPAYEVMGYTKEQWNWAKKNESNLYRYIILFVSYLIYLHI